MRRQRRIAERDTAVLRDLVGVTFAQLTELVDTPLVDGVEPRSH